MICTSRINGIYIINSNKLYLAVRLLCGSDFNDIWHGDTMILKEGHGLHSIAITHIHDLSRGQKLVKYVVSLVACMFDTYILVENC